MNRLSSSSNAHAGSTYTIIVSERVQMKQEGTSGGFQQYFQVYARTADKIYPKVSRTYKDFKSFEVSMSNNLRSSDVECPQLEKRSSLSELPMSERRESSERELPLNDKITNIKQFCKALSADPVFYVDPFFDFFKIPKPTQFEDYEEGGRRVSDVDVIDKFKATMKPEVIMENHHYIEFEKKNSIDYCIQFKCSVTGPPVEKEDPGELSKKPHNFYTFIIKPLLDLERLITIEKRYSEFYQLALTLKSRVNTRPPPLPPKIMMNDRNNLIKRGDALEEWLNIVSNEKMFYSPELFEFIGLSSDDLAYYSSVDMVSQLLDAYTFKFSLEDKKSITADDESFVLWEINIDIIEIYSKDLADSYKVFRRFKEFDHLHDSLKTKFEKYSKKLPELPGKMGYLNILSQSKVGQRQIKLEGYLQLLAEYPLMFNCMNFRKFIELDTVKIDSLLTSNKSAR